MESATIDRKPGQFADEQFRLRHRAWLRRVWWVLPLAAVGVAVVPIALALLLGTGHPGFYAGLGVGAAVAMTLCLADAPPQHVERWRTGADGERRTARAVRPLVRSGWVLLNDLPARFGNVDHVLIGPPGVFLLESKQLGGRVSVAEDELHVHWFEAPEDGYRNVAIAGRARGAAAELSRDLAALGGRRPWVQSVVVLWADFEQGVVEHNRVVWTHGSRLPGVVTARPTAHPLDAAAVACVADCVRAARAPDPPAA